MGGTAPNTRAGILCSLPLGMHQARHRVTATDYFFFPQSLISSWLITSITQAVSPSGRRTIRSPELRRASQNLLLGRIGLRWRPGGTGFWTNCSSAFSHWACPSEPRRRKLFSKRLVNWSDVKRRARPVTYLTRLRLSSSGRQDGRERPTSYQYESSDRPGYRSELR